MKEASFDQSDSQPLLDGKQNMIVHKNHSSIRCGSAKDNFPFLFVYDDRVSVDEINIDPSIETRYAWQTVPRIISR